MGSPSRKPRYSIASKLYALTIQHRMGGMSFGKIEWEVTGQDVPRDNKYWASYPRKLYRYANGAPMNLKRNREMIDVIEARLPGTRRILEHPLWLILENPEASLSELNAYIGMLSLELINKLMTTNKITGGRQRRTLRHTSQVSRIGMINNLDALAALLILVRECEVNQWAHPYIDAKWAAYCLMSRLATYQPYARVADDLFNKVQNAFLRKNDPLPDEFRSAFVDYFPKHFEAPPDFDTLFGEQFINLQIIQLARVTGLVSEHEQEQLTFLFWVQHFFNRTKIIEQLEVIAEARSLPEILPEPLNLLIAKIHGDSRRHMGGMRFM